MDKELEGICKWLQHYVDSSKTVGQEYSTIVIQNEALERIISQIKNHITTQTQAK